MNAAAAAPAWRQYTFFDVVPVKDVNDLANSPEILRNTPTLSTIIASSVGIIVADVNGNINILDQTFEAIHTWVAHVGGRVTHMAESRGILVTIGEETSTRLPLLKIWDVDHFDKKTGSPILLRSTKVQTGNRPHPVSTIALSTSLSHLAIGTGDGTVLLYRGVDQMLFSGSSSLTALPKPRVVHESGTEPITGLGFREPRPSQDPTERPETMVYLFIVTTNHVLSYLAGGKGSGSGGAPTVVDEIGCGLGCAAMDNRTREMVVARDEAIYMCTPDGRGACNAYEGPKSSIYSYKTYVVISSPPFYPNPSNPSATVRNFVARAPDPAVSQKDISKVTVFDIEHRFVAFSGPFKEGVREVVCQWDQIFVLTNDGKLSRLEEKPTSAKLDILFRQSRFLLAINLANTLGVDEAGVADIHRQYGDHLYLKGDYDGAMQQFVKTLGHLQPSYVIRKFLDAQRIHNLTTYLQELHARGLANSDHTTLLLNTYTKLKDVTRLDSFIKTESLRTTNGNDPKDPELPFDLDTAIRVCRQAGYFEHAAYLAKKYERHEDYLSIQIEDSGNFKEALTYLRQLGPEAAESNLARYGRSMLLNLPDEMTSMFIDICSGSTFIVSPTPPQDIQPASPTKPSYLSYLGYKGGASAEVPVPATPVTTVSVATVVPQEGSPSGHARTGSIRRSQHDEGSSRAPSPPSHLLGNRKPPPLRRRPSPRQYFAHFVDHLGHFKQFLEAVAVNRWGLTLDDEGRLGSPSSTPSLPEGVVLDEESDKLDQTAVYNTLLELYLTLSARLRDEGDAQGSAALRNKALGLLKEDAAFSYDRTHALIVCSTRNFTAGLVLLWDKMGMYEDILRYWMEKENSGEWDKDGASDDTQRPSWQVLRHLEMYGSRHPHLYPLVLRFLTSTPALLTRHVKEVMGILHRIDEEKVIPPLGVVQILSRNGVASVGLVKEWLLGHIAQSREVIAADRHLVASYRNETKTKLQEISELSDPSHPRVFHVTRCSSCGGQLDLPAVHFMCKHSYHQRCLADNESECPNCAQSHGVIREIKRDNERFANQHDVFVQNVAEGGFDALASGFSRGLLNTRVPH